MFNICKFLNKCRSKYGYKLLKKQKILIIFLFHEWKKKN